MKLAELHPEHGTADGYKGVLWWLSFECRTSPGGRVTVSFHRAPPQPGIWQCTSLFRIVPGLEHLGELPDIAVLTLLPSIGEHTCRKRGQRCAGHVSITKGEVT